MTPYLSVVIVNYNTGGYLAPCLDALAVALRDLDAEVIVVDNASPDGSGAPLREHARTDAYVALDRNVGFGGANNRGAAHARGEWLFFLNPDTVPSPGSFRDLVSFLRAAPRTIGSVGPTVTNADGTFQRQCVRNLPQPQAAAKHVFPRISRMIGLEPSRPYLPYAVAPPEPVKTECLSGAALAVRRDVFERLGGFDPDYFLFGEDVDLCKRINDAGHECWFTPTAPIVHFGGGASQTRSRRSTIEFYDAARIYYRKHFMKGRRVARPSDALVLGGIRLRCWVDLAMLRFGRRRHVGSAKPGH